MRVLAAVPAEAETTQRREQVAWEAAVALRGELESIKGKGRGGWRGILLRLAGV